MSMVILDEKIMIFELSLFFFLLLYEDPHRYCFAYNNYCMLSRVQMHNHIPVSKYLGFLKMKYQF